jgi:hypothetical protein
MASSPLDPAPTDGLTMIPAPRLNAESALVIRHIPCGLDYGHNRDEMPL